MTTCIRGLTYSEPFYSLHLGTRKDCPDNRGVLNSGVEVVLWQSIVNHLVQVSCVHSRGCPQFRGWIRGAAAVQGSGLEGCPQFRVWIGGVSAIQGLD